MLKGSISYFLSIVLSFFGKNIRFVSKVCIKFIFETFFFFFFFFFGSKFWFSDLFRVAIIREECRVRNFCHLRVTSLSPGHHL